MNALGINLWNWCTDLSDECLGLPAKIAEMGFTAIELPMTQPYISRLLMDEIKQTDLAVTLCAALGTGRDISNFDPAVRDATMQYLTDCLKIGNQLGATVLAGPLYAGGGKRQWLSDDEKKREWELAVIGLRELAYRAENYGMELAIEPLHRYRTSVVNIAAQALQMVEDIGNDHVGVHFDTFHACLEERDLLRALEEVLKAGKLSHFHACANNRGAPGQGLLPWNDILQLLVDYHYDRHITMETFALGGLDSSWVQVHDEPDDLARTGLQFLRNFFDHQACAAR